MKHPSPDLETMFALSHPWQEVPALPRFVWSHQLPLDHFADGLIAAAPGAIHFVGAIRPPAQARRDDRLLRLVTVGRAQTTYPIISQMASALASVIVNTGFFPLIEPHLVRDLLSAPADNAAVARLFGNSIRLYSRSDLRTSRTWA